MFGSIYLDYQRNFSFPGAGTSTREDANVDASSASQCNILSLLKNVLALLGCAIVTDQTISLLHCFS